MEQKNGGYFVRRVEHRLYPNSIQTKMLERRPVLCRRLYNIMFKTSLSDLTNGLPKKSVFDLNRGVKEISDADPELKGELYSTCRYDISSRIHQAMEGCTYDPETGEYGRKPRFRSERKYGSLTYNIIQGFGFEGDKLVIVKIGKIRYRNSHRQKGSEMCTCTIMRKADRWYAIIAYRVSKVRKSEEDLDDPSHPEAYGPELVDLITDTSGEKVGVPDFYVTGEKEIRRIQNRMSKSEIGSLEWEKTGSSLRGYTAGSTAGGAGSCIKCRETGSTAASLWLLNGQCPNR